MSDNRRQILDMLAAGQISAEQADRLIAALEKEPSVSQPGASAVAQTGSLPKYLRVVVESEEGHHGGGPAKVNVRVPLQLLRAGVKLAGIIPAPVRSRVNDALREKGIDFDLGQIKPENLEELVNQLKDFTVDIDDANNKVRVFCE